MRWQLWVYIKYVYWFTVCTHSINNVCVLIHYILCYKSNYNTTNKLFSIPDMMVSIRDIVLLLIFCNHEAITSRERSPFSGNLMYKACYMLMYRAVVCSCTGPTVCSCRGPNVYIIVWLTLCTLLPGGK